MIRTLGTIAVLACLVGQSVRAPAQEGLIEPNRRERILLMKTGRVLKGTIRRVSTGYLVSSGNGYVVIPFNQVRFDADDLQEAYLRLRLLERDPTVASHLALAEWCLSHKLYHESSRELRDALKRDPSNETVRHMLHRVETEYQQAQPKQEKPASSEARLTLINDRSTRSTERQSMAGLTAGTARQFVMKVQPILLNRCGNTRCHGPVAKNEFRLTRMSYGAGKHRLKVERNLAAVMSQIDLDDPSRSSILTVGRNVHGGSTVFQGSHAGKQIETLQQWVWTAAREIRPRPSARSQAFAQIAPGTIPDRRNAGHLAEGAPRVPTAGERVTSAPAGNGDGLIEFVPDVESRELLPQHALKPAAPISPEPLLSSFQQALRRDEKADLFSPEEFNRRRVTRSRDR